MNGVFVFRPRWAGNGIVRCNGGRRWGGYLCFHIRDELDEGVDCVIDSFYPEKFG